MRTLRQLFRDNVSTSRDTAVPKPREGWENTRSCPGSLRLARRPTVHVTFKQRQSRAESTSSEHELEILRLKRQRRSLSDPGNLISIRTAKGYHLQQQYRPNSAAESWSYSGDSSIHTSHSSFYEASLIDLWREGMYDANREHHHYYDPEDQRSNDDSRGHHHQQQHFSLKRLIAEMRPHKLLTMALVFTASYLLYAFYVTVTRVRFCRFESALDKRENYSGPQQAVVGLTTTTTSSVELEEFTNQESLYETATPEGL